jgi:hypothetical protein
LTVELDIAGQANIDFALDIAPFLACTKSIDQMLERVGVFGRIFKPSEEIERLSQFTTMVKTSGDCGQIFETNRDVMRLFLENCTPLILRERPPSFGLADRY